MSSSWSFTLGVGYDFGLEEILAKFRQEAPEKSRMEDRFDPRTGAKTGQEKVVDEEASVFYVVDGKKIVDDDEDFHEGENVISHVAKKAGCRYAIYGSAVSGDYRVLFTPKAKVRENEDGWDGGKVTAGGSLPLKAVVKAAASMEALGKRLRRSGLRPRAPVVKMAWDLM